MVLHRFKNVKINMAESQASDQNQPKLSFAGSRLFNQWMAEAKVSLVFTTYQIGKIFLSACCPTDGYRSSSAASTVVWGLRKRRARSG